MVLFAWVETKRLWDIKNPGSQGDGSFFGITEEFKGKENGYPGEPLAVCMPYSTLSLHNTFSPSCCMFRLYAI
jgi:hypothetical protein